MSAQHTPGPWSLTEKAVVASASTPIAHRVKWWSIGQLEIEENANARLIAAAPDLLESAKRLLRSMESVEPLLKQMTDETLEEGASDMGEDEATREQCAAFLAIRKAIAKATGEKGGA